MDVTYFLAKAADLWPHKEALVDGSKRFSYQEIYDRSRKLSVVLTKKGIGKGQVVSIVAPNSHEFLEAYFACAMAGIILNPINYRLAPGEIASIIADAGSSALLTHADFRQLIIDVLATFSENSSPRLDLAEIPIISFRDNKEVAKPATWSDYEAELDAAIIEKGADSGQNALEQIANLYYTSGTTGEAKGVMLTYGNVSCHALCAIAELKLSDADIWMHAAPMFHLADAWAVFAITAVGGKHVILPYFRGDKALATIESEKISISNLIPTMLNAMINDEAIHRFSYSSLRAILSGGSSISPETVRRIVDAFGCEYVQTYGMTETSPYLTLSLPKAHMKHLCGEELLRIRSRTGRSFMGVELQVVRADGSHVACDNLEVGEIIARGPIVTPGYWNKPQETALAIRDGWLYTGDLAVIDAEGYLNIVDRKKDMIITGGENVYSTEVEHVLYEHTAVLECAVFGLPDPTWGESVSAAVVLRPGTTATAQDLVQFVKDKIAHFKAPRTIEFLTELPKTGSGKIQKKVLRDRQAAIR